jgi:hypothetical protein
MTKRFAIVFVAVALVGSFLIHLRKKEYSVRQHMPKIIRKLDELFDLKLSNDESIENIIERKRVVPNQVMYYWCHKSWKRFEFRHFLSMYSVIRLLKPDVIFFLYDKYPEVDKFEYNVWLRELRETYPFIHLEETKGQQSCNRNIEKRIESIADELSKRGGFYVHELTILSPSLMPFLRDKKQMIAINRTTGHGFLMTQKGLIIPRLYKQNLSCHNSIRLSIPLDVYCINMIEKFYPKDIWELESEFGQLARWAAYGERELMRPKANYTDLAPNIAHYIWIGNGTMDYLWYLSVLSVLYVANVDKVYIHGEAPRGKYWDQIAKNDRVKIIYRYPVTYVFNQHTSKAVYKAEIWRVDVMNKYGGIYLDVDAIFVQPLSEEIRSFDAVINIDFIGSYWIGDYPNILQTGVMVGKPGNQFWDEYLKTMRKFNDNVWVWNSCHLPYKVKEKYPRSLLIDNRLQVNCFCKRCHPTWWAGYKNMSVHHLNSNSLQNWKTDAYSYHFTGFVPSEFGSANAAKTSTTMFGEMARYILDKAGLSHRE